MLSTQIETSRSFKIHDMSPHSFSVDGFAEMGMTLLTRIAGDATLNVSLLVMERCLLSKVRNIVVGVKAEATSKIHWRNIRWNLIENKTNEDWDYTKRQIIQSHVAFMFLWFTRSNYYGIICMHNIARSFSICGQSCFLSNSSTLIRSSLDSIFRSLAQLSILYTVLCALDNGQQHSHTSSNLLPCTDIDWSF